jgi:hypothetical protein
MAAEMSFHPNICVFDGLFSLSCSVKLWTKKRLQKLQPKSNPIYPKALGFIRWVFCRCQIRQHFSDDDIDEKEMLRWFEEFQHKYCELRGHRLVPTPTSMQ